MMSEEKDKIQTPDGDQPISRKEAIYKAGKYAAFTAAAMMMILENTNGQPPDRPPKKSPKKPRPREVQKKATKPKRTDPPPVY